MRSLASICSSTGSAASKSLVCKPLVNCTAYPPGRCSGIWHEPAASRPRLGRIPDRRASLLRFRAGPNRWVAAGEVVVSRMYNACMVALQIRDVPVDVRDRLAEFARARGQSLQAYLLALVTRDAERADNLTLLNRFAGRTDGTGVSSPGSDDVIAEIHRLRDERTNHLLQVVDGTAQ